MRRVRSCARTVHAQTFYHARREQFARLAETRLAQNTLHYIKIA